MWIDKGGFTSIIFDITERVGEAGHGPEIDGRAMTIHLEDMVGSDIDTVKIWNTAETEFTRLEYVVQSASQHLLCLCSLLCILSNPANTQSDRNRQRTR